MSAASPFARTMAFAFAIALCLIPPRLSASDGSKKTGGAPTPGVRPAKTAPAAERAGELGGPAGPIAGLDSLASATLLRALRYLEVRPEELGFDKMYADDDTFRLGVVEEILNDPLRLPGWQERTLQKIRGRLGQPAALVQLLGEIGEAPESGAVPSAGGWPHLTRPSVTPARNMFACLASFVHQAQAAEAALQTAFAGLTPEDRSRLLVLAPAFWGDWEDPVDKASKGKLQFEFGVSADTSIKLTEDPVLDVAVKLNRPALTKASRLFLEAWVAFVVEAMHKSEVRRPPEAALLLPGVSGEITARYETPWGLLVIGGPGPNVYSAEALHRIAFLIEPGGDDVYRGRAASAVGELQRSFSALADLSGDDLYESGGRSYCVGGAVLGIAVLLDLQGNDVYRGGDGSIGAGFFGAGILYDGGGVDFFEGRNLSEGAGAFGLGGLISEASPDPPPGPEPEEDRNFTSGLVKVPGTGAGPIRYDDNDTYQAARYSQGFASTYGVGLLYDKTGNDIYRAGGRYLHRPLLPHDFQSLSQGFSIGFRPRAGGGVGILMDEEGNDFYDAEVYSQGASYWYSLGFLFDGAGNDRYLATQYSQGAGIHLSIGTLWDRGGDDHYVCKLGVTQGTAHDLSVGMQLDESGNDYYVVSDGQGMSITNSVGIFIDEQGNDVYATPGVGQGALTWARGFCGAGIFLDLEGKDMYPAKLAGKDGAVWCAGPYAIGIDLDRDIQLPAEVVPEIVLTQADSARAVKELFETASIWEVGSAREKVKRARMALLTKGMAAVDYCLKEQINSQDGLVYRTLLEVGKSQPDSFTARILARLMDPDQYVQRNVISLLGEMKRKEARLPMESMLKDRGQEKHWTRLIQALGNIGDRHAIPALRPFLRDTKERRRIYSVVALSALMDTASVPVLIDLLEDPLLTVRSAALTGLASFGAAAAGPLVSRLQPDESGAAGSAASGRMIHLRTLGQIADAIPDSAGEAGLSARALARRSLMAALDAAPASDRAAERAAAVEALLKLGDPETRNFVRLCMLDELDPLVLRTFRKGMEEQGTEVR